MKLSFAQNAAPVFLPYGQVKALWESNPGFVKDNDYTDVVFRIMGISRIHHGLSGTFRYLANPDLKFALGVGNTRENPLSFFASEGLFATAYKTLPGMRNGLALLLRDRIEGVETCQPERNIITGLAGIQAGDRFQVTRILSGLRNKDGRINGLKSMPVTAAEAEIALGLMAVAMDMMSCTGQLDLTQIVETVRDNPGKAMESALSSLKNGPKT